MATILPVFPRVACVKVRQGSPLLLIKEPSLPLEGNVALTHRPDEEAEGIHGMSDSCEPFSGRCSVP